MACPKHEMDFRLMRCKHCHTRAEFIYMAATASPNPRPYRDWPTVEFTTEPS